MMWCYNTVEYKLIGKGEMSLKKKKKKRNLYMAVSA